jgi:hypothetical protein
MPEPMLNDEPPTEPCADCESATHLSIVSPTTGLANDYLNVFNEILLVLEFLPTMPEMTDEALAWQPRSYCEYFEQSTIPGARHALQAYDSVDPDVRAKFESILERLTEIVVQAQQNLVEQSGRPEFPDSIVKSCEETAEAMRAGLSYVSRLINEGCEPVPRAAKRANNARRSGI